MTTHIDWAKIHDQATSWQAKLIGDFSYVYVRPKYVQLFEQFFGNDKPSTFLELGCGNGEMAEAIRKKNFGFVSRYITTENFLAGAEWLKKKGFESVAANAENIPFKPRSFDAILSFDVMHHVENPARMACEMLNVGRGKLFLTESNGLSVGRKLLELTPGHRKAGEKSYTPAQYRSFFSHPNFRVKHFEIHPFIFPVRVPRKWMPGLIMFNQWLEKTKWLSWQCSNVYIYVEYEHAT